MRYTDIAIEGILKTGLAESVPRFVAAETLSSARANSL